MPNENPDSGTIATPPASGTNYGGDNPSIAAPNVVPETAPSSTPVTQPDNEAPTETIEQAIEAFNRGVSGTGIATNPLVPPTVPVRDASGQFVTQPVKPAAPVLDYRTYDGLNEEDKVLFKHMSRDAYNKLYPLFLEHKKIKEAQEALIKENEEIKGRHFFEQDNAYTLTPEYQALTQNAAVMDQEIAHWSQQLRNVKKGLPWAPLVPDDKGNPCIGQEMAVDDANKDDVEAFIISKLTEGNGYRNQYQERLAAFHEKFKGEHGRYLSTFDQIEAKIFNGANKEKLEAAALTKLSLFPRHMQGRREIKSYAKALVLLDGLLALMASRQSAANTQAIVQRTAASSGPTTGDLHPVTGSGAANTIGAIQDEMDKLAKNGWQA